MEAQNREQPQPTNPTRPRRKWLRWLAVPAGVAVLALVYQLTRPPELVWWRSSKIGLHNNHIRLLVPYGWKFTPSQWVSYERPAGMMHQCDAIPADNRPYLLRHLLPVQRENGELLVLVCELSNEERRRVQKAQIAPMIRENEDFSVDCSYTVLDHDKGITVYLQYSRASRGLRRTYKQICNSLTIE